MKKYHNKVFKFNQDINRAYRRLLGPTNPAECAICGDDDILVLDIHKADDSNDFNVSLWGG